MKENVSKVLGKMREFTDYPLRLRHIPEERDSQTVHLFTAALYSVEFNIYLQGVNPKVAADCQIYIYIYFFHIQCPALHLNGAAFCLSFTTVSQMKTLNIFIS